MLCFPALFTSHLIERSTIITWSLLPNNVPLFQPAGPLPLAKCPNTNAPGMTPARLYRPQANTWHALLRNTYLTVNSHDGMECTRETLTTLKRSFHGIHGIFLCKLPYQEGEKFPKIAHESWGDIGYMGSYHPCFDSDETSRKYSHVHECCRNPIVTIHRYCRYPPVTIHATQASSAVANTYFRPCQFLN